MSSVYLLLLKSVACETTVTSAPEGNGSVLVLLQTEFNSYKHGLYFDAEAEKTILAYIRQYGKDDCVEINRAINKLLFGKQKKYKNDNE